MSIKDIAHVFGELGELDVVCLVGPEPLEREDIVLVANEIAARSRPARFHLATHGKDISRIETFIDEFSAPETLRLLVNIPDGWWYPAQEGARCRTTQVIDNCAYLARLAVMGVEVSAVLTLHPSIKVAALSRLRARLERLNISLMVLPPAMSFLWPDEQDEGTEALLTLMRYELSNQRSSEDVVGAWKRYVLAGAAARLGGEPNPERCSCTAMRSHVRLRPSGDIVTCGYRGNKVGNLARDTFSQLWFGAGAEEARQEVDTCSGCWAGEEAIPNAWYNGAFRWRTPDALDLQAVQQTARVSIRRYMGRRDTEYNCQGIF